MRRAVLLLAMAALAGLIVIGLTQAGGTSESPGDAPPAAFDLAQARERLQGAPAPLAELHAQSNQLLDGDPAAFERRLRTLRGHPVVVNKWASWCGPCRAELPIFQDVATARGREIAFVGVNARDKRPAAESFAAQYPVPYPSYEDPDERIARLLGVPSNFPVTVFIDAEGETAFVHQGGYGTSAQLAADIERHLGTHFTMIGATGVVVDRAGRRTNPKGIRTYFRGFGWRSGEASTAASGRAGIVKWVPSG